MTVWINVLKRKLKDYKFLFMMSLFPILLTIIFVSMFTKVQELDQEVSFKVMINEPVVTVRGTQMRAYFKSLESTMTIQILDGAKEDVDFIIHIDEENQVLEVENKNGNALEAGVLHTLIEDFNNQYTLREVVGSTSYTPLKLEVETVEGTEGEDIVTPIVVTMLVFGILLGGNYGIKQVFYITEPVGERTLMAPISRQKLYGIEFMTNTLVISVVGILAAMSYELLFDVRFSQNSLLTIGVLILVSMLATLLGMTIGINVKSQDMAENILSLIITVSAILSGNLIPVIDLGKIANFSPIKYMVQALEELVTTGQIASYVPLSLSLLICFTLLIVLSLWGLRRKERI